MGSLVVIMRFGPTLARFARPFTVHRLRLASGLTVFAYVATHLVNHAVGNISVAAMDATEPYLTGLWQTPPTLTLLYLALTGHFLLGLWAFYERRQFRAVHAELWQLTLGLTIPALLITHLVGTRVAALTTGAVSSYGEVITGLWVVHPVRGVIQAILLLVAWTHGCMGVHFWLRLKPSYRRYAPTLLTAATLLPVLALLGFFQAGRTIAAHHRPTAPPAPAVLTAQATLTAVRDGSLAGFGALLLLVLAARAARAGWERRGGAVGISYPNGRTVRVSRGVTILQASLSGAIPHAHVCGGRGRCSTCRVRILLGEHAIPPAELDELAVLHRVGAGPAVRLACQCRPTGDVSVVPLLPADIAAAPATNRSGEERYIVIMVVDMRNSTGMAEGRLPYDAVFLVDRFVDAIGRAILQAGGRPNQFTGDGVFALFGIACGPREACAQALRAVEGIGRNVAALNALLPAPVRFGVGVHGGTAIIGEIGFDQSRIFTALGDPANVASRLESMCKTFECEVVVSEEVCVTSGLELGDFPRRSAELVGRVGHIEVRCVAAAEDIIGK